MTGTSFRDPQNVAFRHGGDWYRIASAGSASALATLKASSILVDLVNSERLLDFELLPKGEEAASVLAAYEAIGPRMIVNDSGVIKVSGEETITYPWEWPNALLATAGQATIDLRNELLSIGLDLKDASATNVQFRGVRPIFIDLGSVEAWRPNPGWTATRQFVENFINPLAVGNYSTVSSAEAWLMTRGRGLRSDAARELMPRRLRRHLGLALLQGSTRPVVGHRPLEVKFRESAAANEDLVLRATRSLNSRLRKTVRSLDGVEHSTTWARYGTRDHYEESDLVRKLKYAVEFIRADPERSRLVLDVGGNDGFTAAHLADTTNARVVVLDSDAGALNALVAQISKDTVLSHAVTPLFVDITNLSAAGGGLLGREFLPFTSRIKPSAVICQAVIHHLVITQGIPLREAVQCLAQFDAPLHIEFATEEDPKVRLLMSQIPGWSGAYTTADFLVALKQSFRRVDRIGRTLPTRIVFSADEIVR